MTNIIPHPKPPKASCILIYTNGSCEPNPGPGGYAAVLRRYADGKIVKRMERIGGAPDTTNNKMELSAAISAIKKIKRDEVLPIFIRTDSKYLVDGWNKWRSGWISRGWRKSNGKVVENLDLWKDLVRLCDGLNIEFQWVRGHTGELFNEEANRLARKSCKSQQKKGAPNVHKAVA